MSCVHTYMCTYACMHARNTFTPQIKEICSATNMMYVASNVLHSILQRWFTSVVMILGALGYSYSISTVASSFGHTAYGRLAFQDRLHNMEFYLNVRIYISYIANCLR